MIPLSLRRPTARLSLAHASLLAGSSASLARTAFVCLGGEAGLASIISIPPPDRGRGFSAAADEKGRVAFFTHPNGRRHHHANGFPLVETAR